jgi:hypothetical protein
MNPKRRRYNIDQIDDPNILKDGEVLRVPMTMMDAAAAPPRRSRTNPTQVTDGTGDPLGSYRPGFRIADGGNEATQMMREANRDWRDAAYDTYDRELRDAWRDPDRTGVGSREMIGQEEGDLCTVRGLDDEGDAGAAGTLQKRGGKLVCVASSARTDSRRQVQSGHAKRMNELYEERDRELRDEWRKG